MKIDMRPYWKNAKTPSERRRAQWLDVAYVEGFAAYCTWEPLSANPYNDAGSQDNYRKHEAWAKGWERAKQDIA